MSALSAWSIFGCGGFGHGILRGEQFKDPFAGGARLGELLVQARKVFHRAIHLKNAAGEQDEIARVGVGPRQINHVKQRHRDAAGGQKINERTGDFIGPDDAHVVADGFARGLAELFGDDVFEIVGFDDALAGEGFAHDLHEIGVLVLHFAAGAADFAAVNGQWNHANRQDDQ